jgi:Uma2 family endonuclease
MTELALPYLELPKLDLPSEDGEPLESDWHRAQINLLIDSLRYHWRDRSDFYAGGNMFIYFSLERARRRDYRGPDFFVALGVDGSYPRKSWIVWEEDGHYPNVIVELLSPTTADEDLTTKKTLYERVFRTGDYVCYEPDGQALQGWQLTRQGYVSNQPNEDGWLWLSELGLWLGRWEGSYLEVEATWLRFFTSDGNLVLLPAEDARQQAIMEHERAEAERERANDADQRAHHAEAELARLRARLVALGIDPDQTRQDS